MMVRRRLTFIASLLFPLAVVVFTLFFPHQPALTGGVQTTSTPAMIEPTTTKTMVIVTKTASRLTPTKTSTLEYLIEIFYYSYYNPDLLAPGEIVDGACVNQEGGRCQTVNCWEYDVVGGKCESRMASGLDWHDYIGKAVACGFGYPLGTIFQVLIPAKLAGNYPCLDRCPACTGKRQLDFLNLTQELPWNQVLLVHVIY